MSKLIVLGGLVLLALVGGSHGLFNCYTCTSCSDTDEGKSIGADHVLTTTNDCKLCLKVKNGANWDKSCDKVTNKCKDLDDRWDGFKLVKNCCDEDKCNSSDKLGRMSFLGMLGVVSICAAIMKF